jgi:hypothetical protein
MSEDNAFKQSIKKATNDIDQWRFDQRIARKGDQ